MQALHVVLAVGGGAAIGFTAASAMGAQARKQLEGKFAKQLDAAKSAASSDSKKKNGKKGTDSKRTKELKVAKEALAKAEKALKNANDAAAKAEKQAKGARDDKAKLESEVKTLKDGAPKTEALQKEWDKTRGELESKIAALQASVDQAKVAAPEASAPGPNLDTLKEALSGAGMDLGAILQALIDSEGQTAALLGDPTGIAVASSGDSELLDGVAAASGALTGIPKQLDNLLAMDTAFTYRLQDGKNFISGRAFESAGDMLALTAVGGAAASQEAIDLTITALEQALS